jgi:hypothetical protein
LFIRIYFGRFLGRNAHVNEYQVRQTLSGADVLLRTDGRVDVASLRRAIESELHSVGCHNPLVTARIVEHIPRIGAGKLKRFVPLGS